MKTGIIVYVTGVPASQEFDEAEAAKHLEMNADIIEVVVSGQDNCYDVWDAWRHLMVNGMHRIICMAAEFISYNRIRLTGREIQLCGY